MRIGDVLAPSVPWSYYTLTATKEIALYTTGPIESGKWAGSYAAILATSGGEVIERQYATRRKDAKARALKWVKTRSPESYFRRTYVIQEEP